MSLFKQYKTDSAKEATGARIVKGHNDDGSEIVFLIARTGKGNTAYKLASERAFKGKRDAIKKGTLSNDEAETILLDLFCGHILKGWENVTDEQGAGIPFSAENAKKLMLELPDLYEELTQESNDISNFLDSNREADAKN